MGFEVHYYYHEKNENGFDNSVTKEMVKRLGSPYEDIPVIKLAGSIMSQLIRRDIIISDVKIYEFAKKEILFKDSQGGIIIKGRKYSYEGLSVIEDPVEELAVEHKSENSNCSYSLEKLSNAKDSVNLNLLEEVYFKNKMPIRYEVYKPSGLFGSTKSHFTIDKKYPIYEELQRDQKFYYVTMDDKGKKAVLPHDEFFLPANLGKLFQEDVVSQNTLAFDNELGNTYTMPSLRG